MISGVLVVLLAAGAGGDFVVDAAKSSVLIQVGKSGLFSFAGHTHLVKATHIQGEVHATPDDLSQSRVSLSFDTAGLQVDETGEPKGDAAKVQEAMLGPRVLDASRFPTVAFKSKAVSAKSASAGAYDLSLSGELSLHGVSRNLVLPLRVEIDGDTLKATGRLVLRQTQFGIDPVSVAGVVKVKDEITVEYAIVANRSAR